MKTKSCTQYSYGRSQMYRLSSSLKDLVYNNYFYLISNHTHHILGQIYTSNLHKNLSMMTYHFLTSPMLHIFANDKQHSVYVNDLQYRNSYAYTIEVVVSSNGQKIPEINKHKRQTHYKL